MHPLKQCAGLTRLNRPTRVEIRPEEVSETRATRASAQRVPYTVAGIIWSATPSLERVLSDTYLKG